MGKIIELFARDEGAVRMPVTIFDVANYFINLSISEEENPITPLKLQKLCYYTQAWSLVWDDKAIFDDKFEAWIHGPANRELYTKYRSFGYGVITQVDEDFNVGVFYKEEIETMNVVWDAYGRYTGKYLEQLTHQEKPWIAARGNCSNGDYCEVAITLESMKEYYSSLED